MTESVPAVFVCQKGFSNAVTALCNHHTMFFGPPGFFGLLQELLKALEKPGEH